MKETNTQHLFILKSTTLRSKKSIEDGESMRLNTKSLLKPFQKVRERGNNIVAVAQRGKRTSFLLCVSGIETTDTLWARHIFTLHGPNTQHATKPTNVENK